MKGEAQEIVDKVLDLIKKGLVVGDDVMISGFGQLSVKSKHPRKGRNPQTGQEIFLDGWKVIIWKYSSALKKAVNRAISP
jgi:integration host factor subunit alpha